MGFRSLCGEIYEHLHSYQLVIIKTNTLLPNDGPNKKG